MPPEVPEVVRSALAQALDLGEVGVQVAAYQDGQLVVDAWAGDDGWGNAVEGSTLFPIFSVTKGFTLCAVHLLAEHGAFDYDDPIARYWPEFARNGKEAMTIRHVIEHRSGLPQMPSDATPASLVDWREITEQIAAMRPLFAPGTASAYQALNQGWILGELVTRVDRRHRPIEVFIAEELLTPLGISDFHMGLPSELEPRVARLSLAAGGPQDFSRAPLRELAVPPAIAVSPDVFNRPEVHAAVIPAAGGIACARSVARLFSMIAGAGEVDGIRLLSSDRVRSFLQPRAGADEVDPVIGLVAWVGAGGYYLGGASPPADVVLGGAPNVLASLGAGGSVAWADLDRRLAVSICHNRMFPSTTPRSEHPFVGIADAVRELAR